MVRVGSDARSVVRLPLSDQCTALAWRGDLLLAGSYDGVVSAHVLPRSALRRDDAREAERIESQPARSIVHPSVHGQPVRRFLLALCVQ